MKKQIRELVKLPAVSLRRRKQKQNCVGEKIVNDEHHFHRLDTQTGGAVATEELEEDAVATMTQVVQVQRLFLHQHIVMPAARVETETTFRHPARDSRLFCGNGYYEIVSLMVRHVSIETLINIGAFDVCMIERRRAKQPVALKSFYMRSPIFICLDSMVSLS